MPTTSLLDRLVADFGQFHFEKGATFHWAPGRQTIVYRDSADAAQLLHELGHGLLGHTEYQRDIQLVEMEQQAWQRAGELARDYNVPLDLDQVEDALDGYREWLHARSTCPSCQATGIQKGSHDYRCLACPTTWRVNDARLCELRRYVTN